MKGLIFQSLVLLTAVALPQAPVRAAPTEVEGPIPFERSDNPMMAGSSAGRYFYYGPAPTFKAQDLELHVSKMGLTLRVKAWVTQALYENFVHHLRVRWTLIHDMLVERDAEFTGRPSTHLVPQRGFEALLAEQSRSPRNQAWLKIAQRHMVSPLELQGGPSAPVSEGEDASKKETLTRIARYLLNDPWISYEDAVNWMRDPSVFKNRSTELFLAHFKDRFTRNENLREGYIGYLTFVYPIAATSAGPFSQPSEGYRPFGTMNSFESRWHSDQYGDQFAGLPFIVLDGTGVAFHGPISTHPTMDIFYLRRDFVSHGCHRMDASDLLELRALLPEDVFRSVERDRPIASFVYDSIDVTDWDGDGKLEAIDVDYYGLPAFSEASAILDPDDVARYVTRTREDGSERAKQEDNDGSFSPTYFQRRMLRPAQSP